VTVSFIVAGDGGRADHVLRARHPAVDRGLALQLLKSGRIVVDGARADLRTQAKAGSVVVVDIAPARLGPASAPAFSVLHESDGVVIVDKRAGIAMHDGPGVGRGDDDDGDGTGGDAPLSTLLRQRFDVEADFNGPSFLGRLDRPTSGLVVAALSKAALEDIEPVWRRGEVRKEYLVVARGRTPASQLIDVPLVGRRPHQRGKGQVEEARTQVTTVAFSERAGLSVVVAELFTGRTHQIRRHLKAIGHPLVGDDRYGARGETGATGLMLHAWRLRRAPTATTSPAATASSTWPTRLPMHIEATLPERFLQVWRDAGLDIDGVVATARALP
jgi:23S rRNA-/tRNA-specific pseudouridylate synthase